VTLFRFVSRLAGEFKEPVTGYFPGLPRETSAATKGWFAKQRRNPMTNYIRANIAVMATSVAMLVCNGDEHTSKITDGNSLLRMCETALNLHITRGEDVIDGTYLFKYVVGFIVPTSRGVAYDLPGGITLEQAVRIIKKWLQDHPNMLNQSGWPSPQPERSLSPKKSRVAQFWCLVSGPDMRSTVWQRRQETFASIEWKPDPPILVRQTPSAFDRMHNATLSVVAMGVTIRSPLIRHLGSRRFSRK
jgi:hypothetical protein